MIPIKYRLDSEAEKEYIEAVVSCMKDVEHYSEEIRLFLEDILHVGYSIGNEILSKAVRFQKDYPDYYYLCAWLTMSFEEIEDVKGYLEELIMRDIENINVRAKHIRKKFKEIVSYSRLQKRRKYEYQSEPTLKSLLARAIEYDGIFRKFQEFIAFYEDDFSSKGINNWIVNKTGVNVCPYCNISYTYNRETAATAQLDHFFPKAEYPMFALCFYNLVPSCAACNRIKSDGVQQMVSPYQEKAFENLKITWKYKGSTSNTKKKYDYKHSLKNLEDRIEIEILTTSDAEQNNISEMKITEAYEHHKDYASEIINKVKTYTNPEAQKLICNVLKSTGITTDEVERFYFGNYTKEEDLQRRPLSKMTRDFYEEYKK